MGIEGRLEELRRQREAARAGGGPEKVERQHRAGKLTARERVELLLDKGSFVETDMLVTHRARDFGMEKQLIPGDGVVTGSGQIDAAQGPAARVAHLRPPAVRLPQVLARDYRGHTTSPTLGARRR